MKERVRNVIVISDTHAGCQLALCPPLVKLDNGGTYHQSALQKKIWTMWQYFWGDWVPRVTKGEPYVVVHNGDAIEGQHHNNVTQISQNITDQISIAIDVLGPVVRAKNCAGYYHVRGTEAHVGKSGQAEEGLAKALGAIPDEIGNHARWEMWMKLNGDLIHFSHHIGVTQSANYELTALYKEFVEAMVESGRWGRKPPACIVRSHRHRAGETRVPVKGGYGISLVTPGWQLKTPFAFRLAMGRSSMPQIGGVLIRHGDEDSIFTRSQVWDIDRPKEVTI